MKRRLRIITDGGTAQENWALDLVALFERAQWGVSVATPNTRPLIERPGPDVLWIVDPTLARRIGDGRFRFLVYDAFAPLRTHEQMAGSLILKMCADGIYKNGALTPISHDCYRELDRQVRAELCEDLQAVLKM